MLVLGRPISVPSHHHRLVELRLVEEAHLPVAAGLLLKEEAAQSPQVREELQYRCLVPASLDRLQRRCPEHRERATYCSKDLFPPHFFCDRHRWLLVIYLW